VEGTSFGRYRLVELLGRGGMGEVWRAYDTVTERVVAVKVLHARLSDDGEFLQRFRREMHAATRLSNRHVIPIHTHGEIDGRLYLEMRLVEGPDLETVLEEGPLKPSRAVRIIDQVAKALQAAHEIGLVHRDVKPSNVLLEADDFAYLIDFGIARATADTGVTGTGVVIGTWAYMAPERFTNPDVDARSDVYALACMLHECLTGTKPFPGDTLELQFGGHLSVPPPQPSVIRRGVPAGFDAVIATGMAKAPEHRYQTALELAHAARDAATPAPWASPGQTHTLSPPTTFHPVPRRRTALASAPRRQKTPAPTPLQPPRASVARALWRPRSFVVLAAVIVIVAAIAAVALLTIHAMPAIPQPIVPVDPPDAALGSSPVVAATRPSVLKIRGVATSCQRILEGTGFVVAPNRIMSTAHVVAGTETVTVTDGDHTYDAHVISYDPNADIAILEVPDLPAAALQFDATEAPEGTDAIMLGYPGGAEFSATPARIREVIALNGPDIYRTTTVTRDMYTLRGAVRQGSSGGPLIERDGRVLGVVFGAAVDDADTGFALTAKEVQGQMTRVANTQPVPTGVCIS
jgi:S1-C subfamily serine protease